MFSNGLNIDYHNEHLSKNDSLCIGNILYDKEKAVGLVKMVMLTDFYDMKRPIAISLKKVSL